MVKVLVGYYRWLDVVINGYRCVWWLSEVIDSCRLLLVVIGDYRLL